MDEKTARRFEEDLLQKRTIYLWGDVTANEANRIGKLILWMNAKSESEQIILYLSTPGGDVTPALDVYDIIRHSRAPVEGRVYRMAKSAGALVLQACASRKAMPHAEIMMHSISVRKKLFELEEDSEKALKDAKWLQQRTFEIFQERTKRPLEELKRVFREEKSFNAQEALEFGLIDEIL
ncbi:ATP-dependent Clp protease proteolytic subunit [Candidatus Azambacteria bacterium]|nr:ATP-dependent Clp protease proteolytic subunit [Candidatus Azambacteria bacterium]MBI3685094.1 ATP-dependent Clp protease proteolytic subunit [Candidatus Azambacteria bacterium]